jgi:twinkle protein
MVQYEDGGRYCHKCGGHDNSEKGDSFVTTEQPRRSNTLTDFSFYNKAQYKDIPDRRIPADVCKKFGVKTDERGRHLFPAYNKQGELVAVKIRNYPEKTYSWIGDNSQAVLFGLHSFPKTGRTLTLTEGEYDAMAGYRMTGEKYPHASLFNGAGSAQREVKGCFEELRDYENIVLNFDNDKPGQDAIEKVGPMLAGRAKTMLLVEGKDACDYLKANKVSKYIDEFHRAKRYTLGGIINGADTWEKYKAKKEIESIPFPEAWEEVNQKTYGVRLGEIVAVVAGTGVGKTQALREMKYHFLMQTKHKIMDISLEEDTPDSVGGLMALHVNKRITLPDVHIDEAEEKKAFDELYGDGRMLFLDHEGSVEDDSLLDKIEYAATVEDCKIIFLDHVTIAISDVAAGNENVSMDKLMNRLLKMVKRLNICIILVSHLRKTGGGKSYEEGLIPTEDALKGSASLKQISMTTLALARNKYADTDKERNTTSLHVLKCRFSGRTGPCDHVYFDDETGRLVKVDPETFFDEPSFDNETLGSSSFSSEI